MKEDAELLSEYVSKGSQPAFAELVQRHVNLVFSVALNNVGRDAHAAKDVAQAVFVALARQAHALTDRRSLAGWLYLTAHHQAAQFVRTERRRQTRETRAHTMNEILNTPEVDWQQLRPVLDDSLRELSEAEREAIVLRYFEDQPFATIGRTFQVSEDAARMRVDRALEKLRALLERRGLSSTAAALVGVIAQQAVAAPAGLADAILKTVAIIPVPPAKPFMTITQIFTGAAVAAAVAALVLARSNDRSSVDAPAVVSAVPRATTVAAAAAPNPVVSTPAKRAVEIVIATAPVQSLEPRDTPAVRSAELARALNNYQPLIEKLNLTTGQRASFNQLLTAHLLRQTDIREVGRTQGTRPVDVDIDALETEADADLSNRVRDTFGAPIQAAFDHFNETAPVREFVHHLTEALATTTTPLLPAQAEQLVEIIAQHSRTPDGRIVRNPRELGVEAAINDSRNPLSPAQSATLRRLQAAPR